MRLNAVKILGISITTNPKKEILEEIQKYLNIPVKNSKKSIKIFTPNTEQLVLAQKNQEFNDLLNRADVAIPDTIGVVWASRLLTKNGIQNTIPGVEFVDDLAALAQKNGVTIGLIGGFQNVAVRTLECLQKKHPGLQGWATEELRIPAKAGIIFIALGPPKQEFFIDEMAKKTKGVIFMSVGGAFDMISGRLHRAPFFMRKIGFEWLWRLILEPWRWKRQLSLLEFIWFVLRKKLRIF